MRTLSAYLAAVVLAGFSLSFLALAQADDPLPVLRPQAVLAGPKATLWQAGFPIYLDATASISSYPLVWTADPEAVIIELDQKGRASVFGIIPNPAPDTDYVVYVTAVTKDSKGDPLIATSKPYRFTTRPAIPVPPVTPPLGPTPAKDLLGLTAYTKAQFDAVPGWSAEAIRFRNETLAPIFLDVAGKITTYKDGNAAITDLNTRYHAAIGTDLWPTWKPIFLAVEGQLNTLQKAGKIKTVADLAEAIGEIGNGIKSQ